MLREAQSDEHFDAASRLTDGHASSNGYAASLNTRMDERDLMAPTLAHRGVHDTIGSIPEDVWIR